MPRELFRPEAIQFQQQYRSLGKVAVLHPLPGTLTAWFLILSTAAIIGFLFAAQYTRKETAVGYLTPSTGTAKVFVPRRGVIKAIHVHEGDMISEGDVLLTVDTDQIAAGGADVNATMLDSLIAQKRLLEDTIAGEERRVGSEKDRLTALERGLQTEISELTKQSALQAERLKVAESDFAVGQQLEAKGYGTAADLRRRRVQMLEQQQGVSTLNQQLASRKNQLSETQFSLEQLPTTMGQKVQALRNELTAAEQRIAEINGRRSYLVKAPTSGQVSTLQATAGQSADPQRLQLEIVPANAVLQAELFLPARAIGFVEPEMPVRILYDAFPYQHFGTYAGRVLRVSQTILTNTDVVGPISLKEPAYRVTVTLDQENIETHGRKIRLQPDMLLKADILLEKRSLMSWLASPLLGIRT